MADLFTLGGRDALPEAPALPLVSHRPAASRRRDNDPEKMRLNLRRIFTFYDKLKKWR